MSIVKPKNFSYLRGPKGEKGDRGEPGSGVTGATGRIIYNSATKTIGFNEVGLATQNYVDISISNIINGAPGVLDTLQELASAINNDAQFFANITSTISAKLNKSGDTMTGFLTLHADPTSNLHAATKKYVDDTTASITIHSTDDVPEGSNLYFTTARARSSISVSGDLSYNNGVISYTAPVISYNDLTNKPTIPSLAGYATESYVGTQIANLVDSAPAALDTLKELATALGNDANFSASIAITLGNKVNTSSLATVATSGSYADLTDKPAAAQQDRLINGSKQVVLQSNGYITLANGAQLYDYGSGAGNGYGITDAANGTYIGYDPSDTLGALHMDSYTGGNIRIRTTPAGTSNYKDWLFNSNGVLSIPAGGDIKDSNNNSVLFSGSYTDLTNKPTITTNINSLTDVDTTTNAPVAGNALIWNGTSWVPGASISAVLADASLDGGDY